jgi:hypothetical protein
VRTGFFYVFSFVTFDRMEEIILDRKLFERERDEYRTKVSEAADQRERAEEALLELARSGERNPTYTLALMEKVRKESLRIRAWREEISRYDDLISRMERVRELEAH